METETISRNINPVLNAGLRNQGRQQIGEQRTTTDPAGNAEQISDSSSTSYKSDRVNLTTSVTSRNLDTVKSIETLHAKMNHLVKGVRESIEELNKSADQISKMNTLLDGITKNFPPFPADSKERQEILMSYSSIRQEILKMTVPPPPPPVYDKTRRMWESLFDRNGRMLATAVPPLQSGSSNNDIGSASDQLVKTGENLAKLSSDITQALIQP